jgi:peptidoglycan hydrolase CwlO-like protein
MTEKKINAGVLYGIIGLLVVVLAVSVYMLIDLKKDYDDTRVVLEQNRIYFAMEKDSLENELHHIYLSYDSLETDNTRIQEEMTIQQEKINRLIAIQADDAYKIRDVQTRNGNIALSTPELHCANRFPEFTKPGAHG